MARPRQVSDDEILEIARQTFLDCGPGVSTTVIAGRVGMSQAALFKRFGTKQGLMLAALAPSETPPFLALIDDGPTHAPADQQLREIGHAVSQFFQSMVPCVSVLHASGLDRDAMFDRYDIPPPVRTQMAMTAWMQRAVDLRVVREVHPQDTAIAFLGTLHIRAFMNHIGVQTGDGEMETYVTRVVDLFFQGIAPLSQETP